MFELFESMLHTGITLLVHLLEIMGVIVILFGAVRDFVWYFTGRAVNIRLGGEILRTVIARDLHEIATVGAIIVLRGALSFLIHWEIGHLEENENL